MKIKLKNIFLTTILTLFALISYGQFDSISEIDNEINSLKEQKEYKLDSLESSIENEISVLEAELNDSLDKIDLKAKEKAAKYELQLKSLEDSIKVIEDSFFRREYNYMKSMLIGHDKLTELKNKRNIPLGVIRLIYTGFEIEKKELELEYVEKKTEIWEKKDETITELESYFDNKIQYLEKQKEDLTANNL